MTDKTSTYHDKRYSVAMQLLLDYLFIIAAKWRNEQGPESRDVRALGKAIHYLMIDGKKKRGEA